MSNRWVRLFEEAIEGTPKPATHGTQGDTWPPSSSHVSSSVPCVTENGSPCGPSISVKGDQKTATHGTQGDTWPAGFGYVSSSVSCVARKWVPYVLQPEAEHLPPQPEEVDALARKLMEEAERAGIDANSCLSRGVQITDPYKALSYFQSRAIHELLNRRAGG